jgi:hypothetical protein
MNSIDRQSPQTYLNVMEDLVQEEIRRQLKNYARALVKYINQVEVATFALNRLPPLYASCEKGRQQQKLLGQQQYREQIIVAVRQGLAAVQRDPIRTSRPLISEIAINYQSAQVALLELQKMLEEQDLTDYERLTWENLVSIVRRALHRVLKPEPRADEPCAGFFGEAHENHGFTASTYTVRSGRDRWQ